MKIRTSIQAGVVATAIALPVIGWSATATTTMAVTTTVLNSCIVVATPLAFGSYDPTAGAAKTGTTTIAVTCTSGAPYNVGLDKGANGSAVNARLMKDSGSNTLPYSLYSDSGRTTIWGNTPATDTVSGSGSGLLQSLTVYGSIPSGQTAPAGAYTDTVNVTVNY